MTYANKKPNPTTTPYPTDVESGGAILAIVVSVSWSSATCVGAYESCIVESMRSREYIQTLEAHSAETGPSSLASARAPSGANEYVISFPDSIARV